MTLISRITNSKVGKVMIGLAAIATLTGCSTLRNNSKAEYNYVQPRNDSFVQLEEIASHDGPETAIYKKSQEEGEKDIAKFTTAAKREDAWVYNHNENKWIDIGEESSVGKVRIEKRRGVMVKVREVGSAGLMNNIQLVLDSAKKGDTITHYHNHPDEYLAYEDGSRVKPVIDDHVWDFPGTNIPESYRSPLAQNFKANFPSGQDCFFDYYFKKALEKKGINYADSRVVGPICTVSYHANKKWNPEKLQKKFDEIHENTIGRSNEDDRKESMEKYIAEVKKLGIDLEIVRWNIDESLPWRKMQCFYEDGKMKSKTILLQEQIK